MIVGGIEASRERVAEFLLFADGVEDAGLVEYARRARVVARDLDDALDELAAERSARVSIQAARDNCIALLTSRTTPTGAELEEAIGDA
jgi:hypothetical protein